MKASVKISADHDISDREITYTITVTENEILKHAPDIDRIFALRRHVSVRDPMGLITNITLCNDRESLASTLARLAWIVANIEGEGNGRTIENRVD